MVSQSDDHRITSQLGRSSMRCQLDSKWFADGLFNGSLGFGGEEMPGLLSYVLMVQFGLPTKMVLILALLAAEITCEMNKDPALFYSELTRTLGDSCL